MKQSDNKPNKDQTAKSAESSQHPLLGLEIPKQSPPKADNMLLDLKETEAWFNALPMANIGETARQVFNTLIEFNRVEIPDLLRAKTVEKFRPPVEYITSNLQKHYVDVGLPLTHKGWKTASLASELQKELAISYKIIVERIIAGDDASFDRRLLVIALHRSLHYLGQTMLQNALVYAPWPEGIWREINNIYAYASQNNVHQVPVKPDDGKQGGTSTSIEDLFKSLVLFASATPHRLRQSYARIVFSHLSEWSSFTSILTEDDGGTSLGRFNVDLWSDQAPMHNSLRTPTPGKRIVIIDVRDLLKQLRADFEQAPWDDRSGLQSGKPVLTRTLLRLLILAWSRPPDRRFVRTRLNFELNVVAGLHAVHGNLMADEEPAYPTTRAALFTLEETDPPRRGSQKNIQWSSGSLENVSLAPPGDELGNDSLLPDSHLVRKSNMDASSELNTLIDEPAATTASMDKGQKETPLAVQTINESAGGYCIRWQGDHAPRVKIGELIGVESPAERKKYGLGVIRWMKQFGDQGLDLGLEVIATHCEAADVREASEASSARARAPSYKCLIINDTDPASNATASLVMNAMNLRTGVDLVLTIGGREQQIRLTKLLEFSSAFARYHFEFVKSEEDENAEDDRRGDEFSDLWSNL